MVFGLFSKEKSLKRSMDRVVNKHAQSADRWVAMEKLRDEGSDESLFVLCRRFSFSYDKTIEDEQEKEWVCDTLIGKGEATLGPLRRYMKSATSVAYPLRVLAGIAPPARALEVVDELLATEEPGYTRDPDRRIQIIHWLGEWDRLTDHDAVARRIVPYLADFDENVKFAAVEALERHPSSLATDPLVAAMLRPEEESKRLKLRIAELLAKHGVELTRHKQALAPLFGDLLSGFRLHRDRLEKQA
jgi:hypothetical protein